MEFPSRASEIGICPRLSKQVQGGFRCFGQGREQQKPYRSYKRQQRFALLRIVLLSYVSPSRIVLFRIAHFWIVYLSNCLAVLCIALPFPELFCASSSASPCCFPSRYAFSKSSCVSSFALCIVLSIVLFFRIVLYIVLYIVLSFSNRLVVLYIVLQLQDRSLLSRLSFELSCYSTHRPVCCPTASESPCCFLNRSTHCLVHCLAASELPCRLLSCSTLNQKSCVFHCVFSEVYYEDCV